MPSMWPPSRPKPGKSSGICRPRCSPPLEQLSQDVGALTDRVNEIEFRARRDLPFSQDNRAAQESAAFALEHMPKAPVFWHPHDTLRFALGEIKGPGLALEFGVATGTTLQIIADVVAGDRTVVGFDTFTGLPETWRTFFPAGEFAQPELPTVPGAELVVGLFEDELPGFLARNDERVAFLHVDCDLYSSTKTVLDLLGDRLAPDAVLLFDEFFNYPGWQHHEYRAWTEFLAEDRTQRRVSGLYRQQRTGRRSPALSQSSSPMSRAQF